MKTIVEDLKKSGFDVYATGSSLERKTYNDVDLVVVPHQHVTHNDALGMLDHIIEQHGGKERSLKVTDFDQKKAQTVYTEEVNDERSRSIINLDAQDPVEYTFINSAEPDSIRYAGSKVEARYTLYIPLPFERELPPLQGYMGIPIFDSLSDSDDLPFLTRDHREEIGTLQEKRKEKTTIDICLSYKPFELVPTTRRIQL